MKRRRFIQTCGLGCLSAATLSPGLLLSGCAGTRYVPGTIEGSFLRVSQEVFLLENEGYRRYVVVQHDALQYPIAVFRLAANDYQALLMKCTHQGTELQVFGDRLQCPAHGSEFTHLGKVQNGPADAALRSFPVFVENTTLKIDLS